MFIARNRTIFCILLSDSAYAGSFCNWDDTQVGFSSAGFTGDSLLE